MPQNDCEQSFYPIRVHIYKYVQIYPHLLWYTFCTVGSILLKGFSSISFLNSHYFFVIWVKDPNGEKALKVLGVGFGERPFFKRVLPNYAVGTSLQILICTLIKAVGNGRDTPVKIYKIVVFEVPHCLKLCRQLNAAV